MVELTQSWMDRWTFENPLVPLVLTVAPTADPHLVEVGLQAACPDSRTPEDVVPTLTEDYETVNRWYEDDADAARVVRRLVHRWACHGGRRVPAVRRRPAVLAARDLARATR